MKKALRFSDIPTENFPLNIAKYDQLCAELDKAMVGFDRICSASGQSVCKELGTAKYHLDCAWALILSIEDRERREDWGVPID